MTSVGKTINNDTHLACVHACVWIRVVYNLHHWVHLSVIKQTGNQLVIIASVESREETVSSQAPSHEQYCVTGAHLQSLYH